MSHKCCLCLNIAKHGILPCEYCDIQVCFTCHDNIELIAHFNKVCFGLEKCEDFLYCSIACIYKNCKLNINDILKEENKRKYVESDIIYNHQTKLLNDILISQVKKLLSQHIILDLCDIVIEYQN